ncbi:MAG: type II secretion system protein [Candidatus Roizmanbacteria bacterium]
MKKAFTLIELLVTIAIIGMLSALLLPNFMAARERGRDVQRKSDLKQIQKTFEMYKQDQVTQAFPPSLPTANNCWSSGGSGNPCPAGDIYINKFPRDPNGIKDYYYFVDNIHLTYILCACLENNADPDGTTGNCDATYTCSSGKRYLVTQP